MKRSCAPLFVFSISNICPWSDRGPVRGCPLSSSVNQSCPVLAGLQTSNKHVAMHRCAPGRRTSCRFNSACFLLFSLSLALQMAAGCELMNAAGKKRGRMEGDKDRREGDRGCESSLNDVLLKVRARSLRWQQPWRTVQTGKALSEIWLIGRSYRRKAERMLGSEKPPLHQEPIPW